MANNGYIIDAILGGSPLVHGASYASYATHLPSPACSTALETSTRGLGGESYKMLTSIELLMYYTQIHSESISINLKRKSHLFLDLTDCCLISWGFKFQISSFGHAQLWEVKQLDGSIFSGLFVKSSKCLRSNASLSGYGRNCEEQPTKYGHINIV